MPNLFDTSNYPVVEPERLQAGDRWMWRRPDLAADYSPSLYALTYSARLNGAGSTSIAITATETSSDYVVEVASATTGAYIAGTYHWVAYITRTSDSQRIEVDRGEWVVASNVASSQVDPRSTAQTIVDMIDAYLKDSNNLGAASYTINGRALSRWPRAELLAERSQWLAEIAREKKADDLAAGLGTNSRIGVRFTSW